MIYRFSPESVADAVNNLDPLGAYTVILGRDVGKDWAKVIPLLNDFDSAEGEPLAFMSTGFLGTIGSHAHLLFCGASVPRVVGDNEFAIVTGEKFTDVTDAAGTNGLTTLPALELKHSPNLVTVDDMETLAGKALRVMAYVELIKGRIVLLEVQAADVRSLFFGRNGMVNVRAYMDEHHTLIVGEPVPEQEVE